MNKLSSVWERLTAKRNTEMEARIKEADSTYERGVKTFGYERTKEILGGLSHRNRSALELLKDELANAGAATGNKVEPVTPQSPTVARTPSPISDAEARRLTIAAATAILREPEPQAITWNAESLAALIDCTYGKGMSRQIAFNAPYESNDELKAISEETQAYPYTSGPGREALSKKYSAAIAKRDAEREAKMKSEAMPKLTQFLCDNKVRVKGLSYAGCKIRNDEQMDGWTSAEAQKSIDSIVSVWSGAEESTFDNSKAANDARSFMVRVNEQLPKSMIGRAAQVGEKLEISKIK